MLRPYQHNTIAFIRQLLPDFRRIIVCLATGAGKTVIFREIAHSAQQKGTVVLIITESRKIFSQMRIEHAKEISAGVSHVWVEPGTIYVAMAQTLAKREYIIPQFSQLGKRLLIITDEAHIGTPTKLLRQFPDAVHLGFTATPDYRSAKHLPELYQSCIVGAQPQELIESGYLSPYYHYERQKADLSHLDKKNGEYTEQSQWEAFGKKVVFTELHNDLARLHNRKTIIFCSSIKHAKATAADLVQSGFSCIEVHSEVPESNILYFTQGNIDICVSVGILTKGFDFPPIDLVVLLRATTSLPLYMQMIGRGSRIHPNKTKFTVLDYGGNGTRHGLWSMDRDWQNMWTVQKKRKEGDGIAPVKVCPSCQLMVSPHIMVCPECGHEWQKPEPTKEEGQLVALTATYDTLRGKKISTLSANELAVYCKFTSRSTFAARIARTKGADFLSSYAKEMGYHPYWVKHQPVNTELEYSDITIK